MNIQFQNIHYLPRFGGGPVTYITHAAQELSQRGHEVSIVCRRAEPGLAASERFPWATVLRHDDPPVHGAAWMIEPLLYARHMRRVVPQLVNGTQMVIARNCLYAFATAMELPALPLVYVTPSLAVRDVADPALAGTVKEAWIRRFQRRQYAYLEGHAVRRARWIVTFSEIRRRETIDTYGVSADRVLVIPPGVPQEHVAGAAVDVAPLRRKLELPQDAQVVLTACRLVDRKNLPLLLRAMAGIKRHTVYLVIVGRGPDQPVLELLAKNLKIADRVRFAGVQTQMQPFYAMADLFVLPSSYEPFGFVLLEAMANGVPCIGLRAEYPRRVVSNDEIIEDGVTGFCVNDSTTALQDAMERVLSDRQLRQQMGQAARERCQARYSWKRHIDSLLDLVKGGA